MRIRTDFPFAVRSTEHLWIPTRDGTKLAARLWQPETDQPVPALLESHPYRLSDAFATRDARVWPWFAGHGYACLRVDTRGSGNSEGVLVDEYTEQEIDDAEDVVAWLAAQPFCDGSVGAFGISWSGFVALGLAARAPEALRAIVAVCASDDRYADDVHYRGGCVLASHMAPWANQMLTFNALPPDPEVVGERWRTMWQERLEGSPPFIETWLAHQTRDDYWRWVCDDYGAVKAPVLAVGGWSDGYVDAVFRIVEHLPRAHGLIGPWSHGSPEEVVPGPRIGFLQECLRWWDRWLRDEHNGVDDDRPLRVYVQRHTAPATFHAHRDGRWIGVDRPGATRSWDLPIDGDVSTRQGHGADAGAWCPGGLPGDWPPDQRPADDESLCATTAPLEASLDVVGAPLVHIEIDTDADHAVLAVRLCDVAPDGSSLLVSRQIMRVARGRRSIAMGACGHRFEAGHRIRVAFASTYFPWAWPPPAVAALRLHRARIELPVLAEDAVALAPFDEPEQAMAHKPERVHAAGLSSGEGARSRDAGRIRLDSGMELASSDTVRFVIADADPLSAEVVCEAVAERSRPGWAVVVSTRGHMRSTATEFIVDTSVRATLNGLPVHEADRSARIPRT